MTQRAAQPALVSIGYEGRGLPDLIEELVANGVEVLVDVRLTPISRKPGLSKRKLSEALRGIGISYVHHRELGNPRENRDGFRAGDPEARAVFDALLEEEAGSEALTHVADCLNGYKVALLCFERDHAACHRGLVANAIQKRMPQVEIVKV